MFAPITSKLYEVHGPLTPSHPSPFRNAIRVSPTQVCAYHTYAPPLKPRSTQPSSTRHLDTFYSHKQVSRLCARFISPIYSLALSTPLHLRTRKCNYSILLPTPSIIPPKPRSTQPSFTRHSGPFYGHKQVSCLCARFISPIGDLWVSTIPSLPSYYLPRSFAMILSQNKYLGSIVAQGMFQLREINQMDWEMHHFCYCDFLLLNWTHSYLSVLLMFMFVCMYMCRSLYLPLSFSVNFSN